MNIALSLISESKISEAEKNLNEFENRMKVEKNKSFFIRYYRAKGLIENQRGNYTKAIFYFNQSIKLIKDYNFFSRDTEYLYDDIAASYLGLQDYKNQSLYLLKASKVNDSISVIEKKILNEVLNEQNKSTPEGNKYFIFIIIAIFFAAEVIAFIINRKFLKIKEEKQAISEPDQNEVFIQNNKIEPPVRDLKELIELAQKNDKSFHLKFSEVFTTFNQRLLNINPQLTHSDLEYCALIKLKFDTKEIAKYRNVTINSVVSKKYRIRKKLNISTSENIYTWMLDIE